MKKKSRNIWFKAKDYGWGWYPSSTQGWLVVILFSCSVAFNFIRLDLQSQSLSETLRVFIPETILLLCLFVIICCLNGESPHWSWGPPQKKIKKRIR